MIEIRSVIVWGRGWRLALRNWVGAFCDSGSVLDLKQVSVTWVLMFVKHIELFTLKIWDILLCAAVPWKYPCSILINVKKKVKLTYDVESQNSNYSDPMNSSPPGSSVHGIFQARVLEWVAVPFSRGSSQPRDWTQVSRIAGRFFTVWATREAQNRLN